VERDPDDKEAVQALVRELKRLKEREQPRRPGPTYYP